MPKFSRIDFFLRELGQELVRLQAKKAYFHGNKLVVSIGTLDYFWRIVKRRLRKFLIEQEENDG